MLKWFNDVGGHVKDRAGKTGLMLKHPIVGHMPGHLSVGSRWQRAGLPERMLKWFRRLRVKLVEQNWTEPFAGYTSKSKKNRSKRKRGR